MLLCHKETSELRKNALTLNEEILKEAKKVAAEEKNLSKVLLRLL